MFRDSQSPGAPGRPSFLSVLAWGVSAVLVTLVVGAATVVLYGMNIADRKTDNLIGLVQQAVQGLPEFVQSLPPVLADALSDERRPDYLEELDVSVRIPPAPDNGGLVRPVIEIHNRGNEIVSLLSMRVVVLDEDGRPISEQNEWGATPFAADHDWRGPLLPGAKRYFTTGCFGRHKYGSADGDLSVAVEVTDLRVWKPRSDLTTTADASVPHG